MCEAGEQCWAWAAVPLPAVVPVPVSDSVAIAVRMAPESRQSFPLSPLVSPLEGWSPGWKDDSILLLTK